MSLDTSALCARSNPSWQQTESPSSNPLLRDAHKYVGRVNTPGAQDCSKKIVDYFADFRPLEQQP